MESAHQKSSRNFQSSHMFDGESEGLSNAVECTTKPSLPACIRCFPSYKLAQYLGVRQNYSPVANQLRLAQPAAWYLRQVTKVHSDVQPPLLPQWRSLQMSFLMLASCLPLFCSSMSRRRTFISLIDDSLVEWQAWAEEAGGS